MGGGLKMDGQNVVSISYGWSVALAGRDNVGGLVFSGWFLSLRLARVGVWRRGGM